MMRARWKTTATLLVLAICGSGVWNSVHAGDDGGGRSVFATGAGNRALALGGAYTALANDASSPLWNPAGLGFVLRRELEVTQTSYYGLGINEQYASFVMPSWRWGTPSLTFRHFGVSGIEQRDDRNALLSEDLSDNELEFSFGFGRQFGDNWSLGTVMKLQHQSLAGFGDTGFGLDLGAMVRPLAFFYPNNLLMERLMVGLFVRNAIRPSLRLDQEGVFDPTGARLGFAYTVSAWGEYPLTLAFDLEQTRGMNTCAHSGFELAVHPLLSLRGGIGDGSFTAGSGMTWNGVSVNYAFENNDFDMVHRIGASFSFGATVEERRLAAREAEENEMHARLAQMYEGQRQERIRQLLVDAEEQKALGNLQEAIRILDVLRTLEPSHDQAGQLKAQYLRALGEQLETRGNYADAALTFAQALEIDPDDDVAGDGVVRCRALSDEQAARSEVIRRRFNAALDAFSRNDLAAARDGFEATLDLAPDDAEAAGMLARTIAAVDLSVANLIDQAGRMIDWGHFDEAEKALDDARRLDSIAPQLDRTFRRLAQARAASERRTTPPGTAAGNTGTGVEPATKPLTDDQKREVEYLYKRAMTAMSKNRIDEALKYWELVWSIAPDYERVVDHLKGEYLRRGMEYFADGDLDKAVDLWEQALRIDPNDERTKGYLTRAREQKARAREIFGGRG